MCKKSAVGVKLSKWLPSPFLFSNFSSIKNLHTSDLKHPQFHKLCSFSRFWFYSYFWRSSAVFPCLRRLCAGLIVDAGQCLCFLLLIFTLQWTETRRRPATDAARWAPSVARNCAKLCLYFQHHKKHVHTVQNTETDSHHSTAPIVRSNATHCAC